MFCDSIQLKYVGTGIYSQKILSNISFALSKLKMIYTVRGNFITLTSYDLFGSLNAFLPLLSPNVMSWLFCLVTLFFHAIPLEL